MDFKETVLHNSDTIVHRWMEEVNTMRDTNYTDAISDEFLERTNREFVNVIFKSIQDDSDLQSVGEFSEKMINLGWPLSYITDGLQAFRRVAFDYILEKAETVTSDRMSDLMKRVDKWVDPIVHKLVNEYSGNWENKLSMQQVALHELAAPLIPVMDKITVMPLVGTVDTERAKVIMDNLLDGVTKHSPEVVLIDITGVPVVDTMVAHHIIQAVEAVRLVGSTCILVGIRPEIAQTIVNLGIDLNRFPTRSSLKKGFQSALEITGQEIVDVHTNDQTINRMIESLNKEA